MKDTVSIRYLGACPDISSCIPEALSWHRNGRMAMHIAPHYPRASVVAHKFLLTEPNNKTS